MSVFTKKLNPLTGAAEWVLQNENYDFHQEIARSAFADMLHDTERNDKYYSAIKAVVEQVHRSGRKAHVLDIGTGTGLLAMMAAKCGADTIYACEAFSPISECAERVIRDNGLSGRITVVHKRSTEMTAGEGGDMPRRANILVTEVFDTELIGEGAIATFNHAHKHLLERDCLVVPTSGTVYAQVVASPTLQRWNLLAPWSEVQPSHAVARCPGAASVHDLQLNQVPTSDFREITSPQPVFHFDWTCRSPILEEETSVVETTAVAFGIAEMVFMWWSLNMDPQGKEVLSCAPWWAHPSRPPSQDSAPWRDHWMQAVYYLPTPLDVTRGQTLSLVSSHDEFSLWFNISSLKHEQRNVRPVCDCMLHVTCSRTRLGMLNDPSRRAKYLQVLRKVITPQTVVLSFGDTSLLGLQAAKLGASKVYQVEENVMSREVMEELVKDNNLKTKVTILDSMKIDEKIRASVTLVLGEPYFLNALYPWDVLRFWFLRQQCPGAATLPVSASLFALLMQFQDLHKIRSPLGNISGFKMTAFDKLIQASSSISDSQVEVHPLWEYPGVSLSDSVELLKFPLSRPLPGSCMEAEGSIPLSVSGTCHGVALWLDFQLSPESECRVSTGPQTSVCPGSRVSWDPYSRQGLYFFPSQSPVTPLATVHYSASFSPTTGEVSFNFSVQK